MEQPHSRYRSRVLREMAQSRANPFNSPPSSTGSHGSVSPTMTSVLSFGEPEAESTRKVDDLSLPSRRHRSTRFGPHSININTSAIERAFPGWVKGATDDNDADSTLNHSDSDACSTKENRPVSRTRPMHQRMYSAGGTPKPLSEMQARVDNESTTSTVLSITGRFQVPPKELGRSASFGQLPVQKENKLESSARARNKASTRPAHLQQMINSATVDTSMNTMNRTMGSFFLPNLTHVQDFVSGTLRLSTMKDGVPVFVKNGKVYDKATQDPSKHVEVEQIDIPEDEQKIFVSMEVIREEIAALQTHHDMLQREAEQLQDDVNSLHSELEQLKQQKRTDSALGSDSDQPSSLRLNSNGKRLEEQVATLQTRLDHASRQISLTEIHQSSLAAERDQAVKELASAYEKMKTLEVQVAALKKDLEQITQLRVDIEALRSESKSLRDDNNALREDRESLVKENRSLRSSNRRVAQQHDSVTQDFATAQGELDELHEAFDAIQAKYRAAEKQCKSLEGENESLKKHNERFCQENQSLRHENSMYERKVNDLTDKCERLQQLIDLLEQETHTQTKTIDAVLELKEENTKLKRELEKAKMELLDARASQADSVMEDDNIRLEAEIELLKKQTRNSQKTSAQLEAENARLRVEMESLKLHSTKTAAGSKTNGPKEFSEIKDRLAAAESEIELLRRERSALSNKFDGLQARYTTLFEDNNRAYKQLDQYQTQFLAAVKDMRKSLVDEEARIPNPPTKQVTFAEPLDLDCEKPKHTASESSATGKTSTGRMEEDFTQQFQFAPATDRAKNPASESLPAHRVLNSTDNTHTLDKNTAESYLAQLQARTSRTYKPTTAEDVTDTGIIFHPEQHSEEDPDFKDTVPSDLPPLPAIRPGYVATGNTHTLPTMTFDLSSDLPPPISQWSGCMRPPQGHAKLNFKPTSREATRTVNFTKSPSEEQSDVEDDAHEVNLANPGTVDLTSEENMTSAFFMPDITIDNPKKTGSEAAGVEEVEDKKESRHPMATTTSTKKGVTHIQRDASHQVSNSASHNAANCTFCTQMCDQKVAVVSTAKKTTVAVSRPVPISDRVLDYTEEPTMRPSRDPGEALAVVIKSLEDEADHLRKVITATRERYDSVDAAINRRARKQLSKDLHQQMRVLDCKNDQIYALYDVLEGQKCAGQHMSRDQLDLTVCSIIGMTLDEMSVVMT